MLAALSYDNMAYDYSGTILAWFESLIRLGEV